MSSRKSKNSRPTSISAKNPILPVTHLATFMEKNSDRDTEIPPGESESVESKSDSSDEDMEEAAMPEDGRAENDEAGAPQFPLENHPRELSDGSSASYDPERVSFWTDKELKIRSDRRLRQFIDHSRLEHFRLHCLEIRLRALEKRGISPEIKTEKELPAHQISLPGLNPVSWAEFKELSNKEEHTRYAIDVLVGDPILFYQRSRHFPSTETFDNKRIAENQMMDMVAKEFPERIRINSIPLLGVLRDVTGSNFDDSLLRPLVILRPYKPLMYHLKDLKAKLKEFDDRWNSTPGHKGRPDEKPVDDVAFRENDFIYRSRLRNEESSEEEIEDAHDGKTRKENELCPTIEAWDNLHRLIRFLDECKEHFDNRMSNVRPHVYFRDLWHLFQPGTFVVAKKRPQVLWRVLQATGGRSYLSDHTYPTTTGPCVVKESTFDLTCYHIDYDGKEFGPVQDTFKVPPFEGWREITSLDILPLDYLEHSSEVAEKLTTRGERFIKASGVQHMYCKGRTLVLTPAGQPVVGVKHPEDVDSAVMVDFDRALQFNPDWRPVLGFTDVVKQDPRETQEMTTQEFVKCGYQRNCLDVFCCRNENIVKDYRWDQQRMTDFTEEREMAIRNLATDDAQLPIDRVPKEEWKLLPNRVFGFVLRSRSWASMRLDQISEVEKDTGILSRLELPPGHERIVTGLVKTHFNKREKTDPESEDFSLDPVRAKGKGLIILLHGAPGVGKTSTAECVAAANAKPLFPITCGDLGMDPSDVESNLELNFQLAQSWGCVLLLDEADVFLAERLKPDVKRNALVSVFLRALEYYTGVLFLTTNRVGTLDEAFKSRIHMSLLYPALDWDQTKAVWTKHLDFLFEKRPDIIVDRSDIMDFARTHFKQQVKAHKMGWNGRQIRNALQTAVALADFDSMDLSTDSKNLVKTNLRREGFEKVAKAAVEFDEYLKKTLHQSLTDYTNSQHWRTDTYRGPRDPPAQHEGTAQDNIVPNWAAMNTQHRTSQWPAMTRATAAHHNVPGYGGLSPTLISNPQVQAGFSNGFPGLDGLGNTVPGVGQPSMGMQNVGYMATIPNMQRDYSQMSMNPNTSNGQAQMLHPSNVQTPQCQTSMVPGLQSPQSHITSANASHQAGHIVNQPTHEQNPTMMNTQAVPNQGTRSMLNPVQVQGERLVTNPELHSQSPDSQQTYFMR